MLTMKYINGKKHVILVQPYNRCDLMVNNKLSLECIGAVLAL